MGRHNREARGSDQRGFDYEISYPPDWLKQIKVTRTLESGRQSTKTLFRNAAHSETSPTPRVRTQIKSEEQRLDFEIEVDDPRGVVKRIIIVTAPSDSDTAEDELEFTLEKQDSGRRIGE